MTERFSASQLARGLWLAIAIAIAIAGLAGCANVKPAGGDRPPGGDIRSATPAPAPAATGRRAPRGSGRAITLIGNCKQTEVDGFSEDAQVDVADGSVRSLSWKMKVGRRGSCTFDGAGFRQTRSAPSIEMVSKDGSGCRLLMWSDDRRITLAHDGCEKHCTKGVYDKAWPVMFDPGNGRCADTTR